MIRRSTHCAFFHGVVRGRNQMLELRSPLAGLTLEGGAREPVGHVFYYGNGVSARRRNYIWEKLT